MKEIEDATYIRSRLLAVVRGGGNRGRCRRSAQRDLAFVIVGGGPTGVELAGAIKELAVDVIPRDFRIADTRRARVILIEAGPRLLPALHPDSSRRALAQLQSLGVDVRLGQPVTHVFEDGVEVNGERLRSRNVIWAAGVRASPLVETLGVELGAGRRVKVARDCSIPGHPNVFVIGDAAFLVDARTRQGRARRVAGRAADGPLRRARHRRAVARAAPACGERGFHYRDFGSMATVGKSRAVVEIGRLRFGGLLAWLAWLGLHVTVLIGFRNRLAVLASWIYELRVLPARCAAHHRPRSGARQAPRRSRRVHRLASQRRRADVERSDA